MALRVKLLLDFLIAGKRVALSADYRSGEANSSYVFSGQTAGLNLPLRNILDDLLKKTSVGSISLVPEELIPDLYLEDIYVSYDTGKGELNFIALTTVNQQEIQFVFNYKSAVGSNNSRYAFGIQSGYFSLSSLPMVGNQVAGMGLDKLGFLYASESMDAFAIPRLSAPSANGIAIPRNIAPDPFTKCVKAGFNLLGHFCLPVLDRPLNLGETTEDQSPESSSSNTNETSGSTTTTPASLAPSEKWFELNKKAGPLLIKALGLSYQNGELALLVSGDVNLGGLTVSLIGLGAGFHLSSLLAGKVEMPSVRLAGLGMSVKKPPMEISGGFLKEKTPDGKLSFSGAAMIKAQDFTLSALGGYSTVNGDPSLFVFALHEGALGGPAFFAVEGLAAGFGYNRRVIIPEVEEVANFPFVRMAMAPAGFSRNPVDILPSLSQHITPSLGDYWFALGVKFNSFKLVDSFALMIASLGKKPDFRLDILGVSKLTFPVQQKGKKKSSSIIAEVRMAYKGTFIPSEGFLGIEARLSEGSYVLSKDCVLSGGFAFFSWFEGSAHEGDFVQSMGGYHPDFKKPAHYPDVPRLAFNWNVNKNVVIKGEMYFAMTPSMCMAGGRLEASYKKGSISAWFIVSADFLISWEPYFYDARFHVNVGARYKQSFAFFDLVITVDVGADVHISGPEMKGTAAIDIGICTIDVSFGASSSPLRSFINWEAFQTSFLPKEKDICKVLINNGLIPTGSSDQEARWIINPKDFVLSTGSVIPLQKGDIPNGKIKVDPNQSIAAQYDEYEHISTFGIEPIGLTRDEIASSCQTITIYKEGGNEGLINNNDQFLFQPITQNFPKALWQEAGPTPGNPDLTKSKGTIENILAGFRISPAKPPSPGTTKVIDQDIMKVDMSANDNHFKILPPTESNYRDNGELTDISTTIYHPAKDRAALLAAFSFEEEELDLFEINEDCFLKTPLIIEDQP